MTTAAQPQGYWPDYLPRNLHYPPVTAADLHASTPALYGDRVALVDGDESFTFTQMHEEACRIANGLRAAGIGDGDVCVLHMPNGLWFLPAYFGILLAGASVTPTNPLSPVASLKAQIAETGAKAGLSHPDYVTNLASAAEGSALTTIVAVEGSAAAPVTVERLPEGVTSLADFVAGQPATRPESNVTSEDVAHLAYTGGTTGFPKAVRVLHRNVVANVTQMVGWRAGHSIASDEAGQCTLSIFTGRPDVGVTPGDAVSIVVGPLYHAHALINANFLSFAGARLVILGRFSPALLLETIEREKATYVTGSPAMWHALLNSPDAKTRDLSSLRVLSSGAAPIDPPTLDKMHRMAPNAAIVEGYGLTEGTCVVTAGTVDPAGISKVGSVGVPLHDTIVEIRGPEGEALPVGERGEIWIKGPQVTGGYLDRPDATAEQYIDGWLATGDIAYYDEDGFLFICDRAKDMLIYKGYNVYPRELENILVDHPSVSSAAVVGRDVAEIGQEPVAFVVPEPGQTVDPAALMAFVAERVLPYQKVRDVVVVDALPGTGAGKILKNELRDRINASA